MSHDETQGADGLRFTVDDTEVELVEFDAAWVECQHYAEVQFPDGRRELRPWADVSIIGGAG